MTAIRTIGLLILTMVIQFTVIRYFGGQYSVEEAMNNDKLQLGLLIAPFTAGMMIACWLSHFGDADSRVAGIGLGLLISFITAGMLSLGSHWYLERALQTREFPDGEFQSWPCLIFTSFVCAGVCLILLIAFGLDNFLRHREQASLLKAEERIPS